jgi:hypothetical protein
MAKDTEMQEALKKIREQEEANKTAEYRQKLSNERMAKRNAEIDEAKSKLVVVDEHSGKEKSVYDDVIRTANNAINKEQTTVNDWKNAMQSLVQMFSHLVTAWDASLGVNVGVPLKQVVVDKFLVDTVYGSGIVGAVNGIRHLVSGDKPIELPSLAHHISFTNDNKLQIDDLVRSDAGELGDAFQKLFKKGVHKWLEEKGYTPDPNDETKFVDSRGRELTKDKFDDIKESFAEFLSESSDLTFTARP